jgi:TolA-binding protein
VKKIIVLIAIILLSCCATGHVVTGPEKQFQGAAVCVNEKRYKEAAAAYRKIVADAPGSALAADALFELALVQAHHDNPHRDYVQAIQTFDQFIRRYPDSNKTAEAQIWVSVLKTVQELKKENAILNESIEQLKRLDIRHEERRKGK